MLRCPDYVKGGCQIMCIVSLCLNRDADGCTCVCSCVHVCGSLQIRCKWWFSKGMGFPGTFSLYKSYMVLMFYFLKPKKHIMLS